jgi:putative SOS response-associated peptidase YedK
MCGRFVALTDPDGLVRFFVVDDRKADDVPPNPNVAPTEDVYAVAEHDGRRVLTVFRWGLVPHWADDMRIGARMINARAETVAEKPAFRSALERRRCLIPANGFYEWQRRTDGTRIPHFIGHRDGTPLAFAGLWESWRDPAAPDRPRLLTCTIVTTQANATVRPLHDRMPVVLPPDRWEAWLDRGATDLLTAHALLHPAADDLLAVHEVSRDVNDARNKRLDLPAPVGAAHPPAATT